MLCCAAQRAGSPGGMWLPGMCQIKDRASPPEVPSHRAERSPQACPAPQTFEEEALYPQEARVGDSPFPANA